MCGITGVLRLAGGENPAPDDLAPALLAMRTRGPDGEGVYRTDGLLLGNRRLAVIDRAGGAQPMATEGGAHVLVQNGEIFDYREHGERLAAGGVELASKSDTEVLLHLLAAEGTAALSRVTGMFAFGHWDDTAARLTLARDPFGIKPLLYAEEEGRLRFGSDLSAFLSTGTRPLLDLDALAERIAFQLPLTGRTLVRGVRTLAPGGTLVAERDGRVRTGRWHEVVYEPDDGPTEAEWESKLRDALVRAVRLSLRADVPVGVTLSGGLDSSLVAAIAAREAGPGPVAFTGWFGEGPAYDERPHARAAADAAGLELVEIRVTAEDLLSALPRLAVALEGPIAGPGALPQYVVAARAKERVTVLLTGQGADETFGGYARHRLAWLDARGELDPDALPDDLRHYRPLALHLMAEGAGDPFPRRFFRTVYRGDGAGEVAGPLLREAMDRFDPLAAYDEVFTEEDGDPFHRMVSFERRTLLPALLHVEDRVTMAHGVESRVPLLDPGVVDLSARMPTRISFGSGEPKRILRRAARGLAPDCAVQRRDKMGYPVPLDRWARGPLRDALRERLEDGPLVPCGLLAEGAPERLVSSGGGHGRLLWFFLVLSEWMRETGVRP